MLVTNVFLLAKRNHLILVHYSNFTYKFLSIELTVYRNGTWHFTVQRATFYSTNSLVLLCTAMLDFFPSIF